jgi:hypothetical protein
MFKTSMSIAIAFAVASALAVGSASAANNKKQPRHVAEGKRYNFSPPQGETCKAKCEFHVNETGEKLSACLVRHCSGAAKTRGEHW